MSSGNQYRPPTAPVERPEDRPRFGIRWRALGAGALVDLGLTIAALIGLGIALAASGSSLDQIEQSLTYPGGWPFWASLAAALASSVVGGYVAGRVAGFAQVKHGFLAVLLLTIVFLPAAQLDGGSGPGWLLQVTSTLGSLSCGAFGGWLAQER